MLTSRNEHTIISYPYGDSLAEKNIDNCPIEVFKPESSYYKSLIDIIKKYTEMIRNNEEKLALLANVDVYVNEHFSDEYGKAEQKVLAEIEEVKRTYTNPKVFIDKLLEVMDHLDDIVIDRLHREYYKENHVCPEMKDKLEEENFQYKCLIDQEENTLTEWKEYCLDRAKEEEKEMLKKLLKAPHTKEDVIIHVTEFIKERLGYEFSELMSYYNDLVIDVVHQMTSETKYDMTIQSVISERGTTNFYRIFDSHNEFIKTQLLKLTIYMTSSIPPEVNDSNNGFVVAEELLKRSFERFINKHFMEIAQILRKKIMSANAENGFTKLNVQGSVVVKNIAREFIYKVTRMLKEEVEDLIMQSFNSYFSTLKEQFNYNPQKAITAGKVNVEVDDTNEKEEFIDFIDAEHKYSIKELTDLYNEYHETTLSTISVSKLAYIRQHFDKQRETNPKTHKQEYMYTLKY